MLNFDIFVVASKKRPSLVTEYLTKIEHTVYYTPDYDLPQNWEVNPNYLNYVENHIGAYRCFRGHQDVLKMMTKDMALVFEDDAVPNRNDWLEIANKSIKMLEQFEIVSLHGRMIMGIKNKVVLDDLNFVELSPVKFDVYKNRKVFLKKSFGSLAYLIKKNIAQRIIQKKYEGYPMDLYLMNEFCACILEPSPFDHDRRHGTLIG